MKLKLPNVTICFADTLNQQLALRSMLKSSQSIEFGRYLAFTDVLDEKPDCVEHIKIDKLDGIRAYNKFMVYELCKHIQTDYVLVVQWDSWIVKPEKWTREFLEYDYIGAPWHNFPAHANVGNGGFSLRSRKLLDFLRKQKTSYDGETPEDVFICHTLRKDIQQSKKLVFAPESIAVDFSYERVGNPDSSMAFHGIFNFHRFLESDQEMSEIFWRLDKSSLTHYMMYELVRNYMLQENFASLKKLLEIVAQRVSPRFAQGLLYSHSKDLNLARQFLSQGVIQS